MGRGGLPLCPEVGEVGGVALNQCLRRASFLDRLQPGYVADVA